MSINETLEKIKGVLLDERFFVIILICLVGITSFGLGRLSVKDRGKEPVRIEQVASKKSEDSPKGDIVASKNGTKYHFVWCSGAKSILPENLIHFQSIEHAKSAGYTPAANCSGLK